MLRKILSKVSWLLLAFLVMFIFLFLFKFCVVNGDSMYPTAHNNDLVLTRMWGTPDYGDIVCIYSDDLDKYLYKRVIGLEGDSIKLDGQSIYVNDVKLSEPYAYYDNEVYTESTFTVNKDCIFVMGDNRNNSLDSRVLGSLPVSDVKSIFICNISELLNINYNTIVFVLRLISIIFCVIYLLCCLVKINKTGD